MSTKQKRQRLAFSSSWRTISCESGFCWNAWCCSGQRQQSHLERSRVPRSCDGGFSDAEGFTSSKWSLQKPLALTEPPAGSWWANCTEMTCAVRAPRAFLAKSAAISNKSTQYTRQYQYAWTEVAQQNVVTFIPRVRLGHSTPSLDHVTLYWSTTCANLQSFWSFSKCAWHACIGASTAILLQKACHVKTTAATLKQANAVPEKNLKQKKRQIQAVTQNKDQTAAIKLNAAKNKRNGDSACEARLVKRQDCLLSIHFLLLTSAKECYQASLKSRGPQTSPKDTRCRFQESSSKRHWSSDEPKMSEMPWKACRDIADPRQL